jgi:hypothetical protein
MKGNGSHVYLNSNYYQKASNLRVDYYYIDKSHEATVWGLAKETDEKVSSVYAAYKVRF